MLRTTTATTTRDHQPEEAILTSLYQYTPNNNNTAGSNTDAQTGGDDVPQFDHHENGITARHYNNTHDHLHSKESIFDPSLECEYKQLRYNFGQYCHFTLYESYNRFYLVGCDSSKTKYKLLKIDKIPSGSTTTECEITDYFNEDAGEYTLNQINDLLHMVKLAMKSIQQDLKLHTNHIYGILGFVELKLNYYMVIITGREKVGTIGNASVYEIKDTKLVHLSVSKTVLKQDYLIEEKYKELFNGINLHQDFYFSYQYDLSKTLQQNCKPVVVGIEEEVNSTSHSDMFVWNSHLMEPMKRANLVKWMCPCIHGHFLQSKISMSLSDYEKRSNSSSSPRNRTPTFRHSPAKATSSHDDLKSSPRTGNSNISIVLTVIARRSRFYAGTRYLKRGISESGHVANHVEIEQIVYESNHHLFKHQSQGAFSSFVQVRGSIPLHWSQSTATTTTMTTTTTIVDENDQKNTTTTTTKASTSNLLSKPNIIITKFDPLYETTLKHFDMLIERHEGVPIMCLDLVKMKEKKPREMILGEKFKNSIEFLNKNIYNKTYRSIHQKHNSRDESAIEYIPFDFRTAIKDKPEKALNELHAIAENHVRKCKFFVTSRYGKVIQKQQGILRTNCIDCLDRTGVAQYIIAKYVLGEQLCALGIIESPHLVHHGQLILILLQMYEQVSDHIAIQYSGSKTVSVDIHNRGGVLADLMTNMKRYYSSNFKDEWKQHAINIFLGNFKPSFHIRLFGAHLWDLESGDIYLHNENERKSLLMDLDEEEEEDQEEDVQNTYFDEMYNPRQVTNLLDDENLDQLSLTINSEVEEDIPDKRVQSEESKKNLSPNLNKKDSPEKDMVKLSSSPNQTPEQTASLFKTIMNSMKLTPAHDTKFPTLTVLPQGEILRSLEGRMSNEHTNMSQEILRDFYDKDANSIYNNVTNTRYIERNIIQNYDMDIYTNYTSEFNNELIEERNMSSLSMGRSNEYNQYISQYFKDNIFDDKNDFNSLAVSLHNQTLYGQYTKYQHDISFFGRKEVSKIKTYKQLVSNEKKTKSSIIEGPLSDLSSLSLLYRDDVYVLNKMKKFFPLACEVTQLVSHLHYVVSYLKHNLTLLDRVRYPKQNDYSTSLYQLLKGKIYRKCFEAKEAIDLLISFNDNCSNSDLQKPMILVNVENRKQAVEFFETLLECNVIHHVNYGISFMDGYYLYRFSSDNPVRVLNMSLPLSDVFHHLESIESIRTKCEPNQVLYKLMEYLRQMYQEIFPKYDRFNFRCNSFFKTLAQHSRKIVCTNSVYVTRLLPLCHELSRIDLSSLIDVHEEKNERIRFKTFFLNLFLTLFYHSLLIMGSSSKYRIIGNNATYIFYNRMAYNVDGLIFSLSDIRDGILRGNKRYANGIVTDPVSNSNNSNEPPPVGYCNRILLPPFPMKNSQVLNYHQPLLTSTTEFGNDESMEHSTNSETTFDRRSRFLSFYANHVDLRLLFVIHRYAELLWNEKSQISILPNSQQVKNMRMRNCCTLLPYITPENFESFVRKETELFLLQHIKIMSDFSTSTASQTSNLIILPRIFRTYRESFGYTLQDISRNLIEKCMNYQSENEPHSKAFNMLREQLRHVHKNSHIYTVKEEEI
ncbi:hypothetical protein C9374_006221 [Naegleria lovaniensis]|uniref:SAC domain-containing protein n=1 Tax=Naegleria lovaniensis TaxID=51637 RepID=A0AA88GP05_NAELO|nr:uncharacterized protein C9374_006221 [Naegleria lovaniensis]KAG2381837.1 hypothetical protein C9374_006221 [Naegleria lovaniensis]